MTHLANAQGQHFDFDIPAQPLAAALEQYVNVTGRNALYNSNFLISRHSTALQGRMSSDAALKVLLEGTGLSARRMTADSFVLVQRPAVTGTDAVAQQAVKQYYGRIQVSLQSTLCAIGDARPGDYRIGMRLWIDEAGNVIRHERLTSTGVPHVDARIDQTLRRLRIGAPPPPGFEQPVSIVILPQGPGVTMGCTEQASVRAGGAQ